MPVWDVLQIGAHFLVGSMPCTGATPKQGKHQSVTPAKVQANPAKANGATKGPSPGAGKQKTTTAAKAGGVFGYTSQSLAPC